MEKQEFDKQECIELLELIRRATIKGQEAMTYVKLGTKLLKGAQPVVDIPKEG